MWDEDGWPVVNDGRPEWRLYVGNGNSALLGNEGCGAITYMEQALCGCAGRHTVSLSDMQGTGVRVRLPSDVLHFLPR